MTITSKTMNHLRPVRRMTAQQCETYFGSLAARIGSNAVRFALHGKEQEAMELAKNAASMAFNAYPYLLA